jgi:hypothetical protein
MIIRPVVAELFQADRETDGQTNITMLVADFRNFSNSPKKEKILIHIKIIT